MRKLILAFVLLFTGACGTSDEGDARFTLEVEASPATVISEIGKFDGGSMPRLLGIKAPAIGNAGNGKMRVTVAGERGQKGTILFAVAGNGAEASTIAVDIDLPATVTTPDGKQMQVRGRHAADTLESELRRWTKGVSSGRVASWHTAGVNKALTAMAVVMAPHRQAELKEILRTGQGTDYARTQAEFHGSDPPGIGWKKEEEPEGFGAPDNNADWADAKGGSDWAE